MDAEALRKTREHYNSHANLHEDREQAMEARRQGKALPLKDFHNDIKRKMINRFAWQTDKLLDLACGRGGDIHKWARAGIKYVKGIDLSPGEIEEAQRRFDEFSSQPSRRRGAVLQAEFVDSDQLGASEWREPQQYDAITCMFAIHYFFVSQAALHRFMANVSLNLREGGYFFGTFPSGKRVQAVIHKGGAWPLFKAPMLELKALWKGEVSPFGCAYNCAIGDTVTAGQGQAEGSYEYLVFNSTLLGVAAEHGLHPITDWEDPELDECFDEADRDKAVKHFNPSFPPTSDSSLSKASSLFAAFAFQKRTKGDPPAAGGATEKRGLPGATHTAEQSAKRVRVEPPQDSDAMLASSATQQQQPITSSTGALADSDGAVDASDQQADAGQTVIQALPAPVPAPLYKRPKPRARPAAASTGQG